MKLLALRFKTQFNDAGAVIVEFAWVAPLYIMLLIGATDVGMGILAYQQVRQSAHAGIEYSISQGYDATGAAAAVANAFVKPVTPITINASKTAFFCGCSQAGVLLSDATVSSSGAVTSTTYGDPPTCGKLCASGFSSASYLRLTAQATYVPIVGRGVTFFDRANIPLSATVVARVP